MGGFGGGTPIKVGREMTADEVLQRKVACVERGKAIGDVRELFFHYILTHRFGRQLRNGILQQRKPGYLIGWIRDKVSTFPYFIILLGSLKGLSQPVYMAAVCYCCYAGDLISFTV